MSGILSMTRFASTSRRIRSRTTIRHAIWIRFIHVQVNRFERFALPDCSASAMAVRAFKFFAHCTAKHLPRFLGKHISAPGVSSSFADPLRQRLLMIGDLLGLVGGL